MKNETLYFILFCLLLSIILILLVVIKIGGEAAANPLPFGAKQLGDSNNAEVYCSCIIYKSYDVVKVNFNSLNKTLEMSCKVNVS